MAKINIQDEATIISIYVTEFLDKKKADFAEAGGGAGNPTWSIVDCINAVKQKIKYDITISVSTVKALIEAWATANGYTMVTYV